MNLKEVIHVAHGMLHTWTKADYSLFKSSHGSQDTSLKVAQTSLKGLVIEMLEN